MRYELKKMIVYKIQTSNNSKSSIFYLKNKQNHRLNDRISSSHLNNDFSYQLNDNCSYQLNDNWHRENNQFSYYGYSHYYDKKEKYSNDELKNDSI